MSVPTTTSLRPISPPPFTAEIKPEVDKVFTLYKRHSEDRNSPFYKTPRSHYVTHFLYGERYPFAIDFLNSPNLDSEKEQLECCWYILKDLIEKGSTDLNLFYQVFRKFIKLSSQSNYQASIECFNILFDIFSKSTHPDSSKIIDKLLSTYKTENFRNAEIYICTILGFLKKDNPLAAYRYYQEFKAWNQGQPHQPYFNMAFLPHFIKQLESKGCIKQVLELNVDLLNQMDGFWLEVQPSLPFALKRKQTPAGVVLDLFITQRDLTESVQTTLKNDPFGEQLTEAFPPLFLERTAEQEKEPELLVNTLYSQDRFIPMLYWVEALSAQGLTLALSTFERVFNAMVRLWIPEELQEELQSFSIHELVENRRDQYLNVCLSFLRIRRQMEVLKKALEQGDVDSFFAMTQTPLEEGKLNDSSLFFIGLRGLSALKAKQNQHSVDRLYDWLGTKKDQMVAVGFPFVDSHFYPQWITALIEGERIEQVVQEARNLHLSEKSTLSKVISSINHYLCEGLRRNRLTLQDLEGTTVSSQDMTNLLWSMSTESSDPFLALLKQLEEAKNNGRNFYKTEEDRQQFLKKGLLSSDTPEEFYRSRDSITKEEYATLVKSFMTRKLKGELQELLVDFRTQHYPLPRADLPPLIEMFSDYIPLAYQILKKTRTTGVIPRFEAYQCLAKKLMRLDTLPHLLELLFEMKEFEYGQNFVTLVNTCKGLVKALPLPPETKMVIIGLLSFLEKPDRAIVDRFESFVFDSRSPTVEKLNILVRAFSILKMPEMGLERLRAAIQWGTPLVREHCQSILMGCIQVGRHQSHLPKPDQERLSTLITTIDGVLQVAKNQSIGLDRLTLLYLLEAYVSANALERAHALIKEHNIHQLFAAHQSDKSHHFNLTGMRKETAKILFKDYFDQHNSPSITLGIDDEPTPFGASHDEMQQLLESLNDLRKPKL